MANVDNPHGFRPLARSVSGGPGAAMMGAHKLVGYGTALFIGDAVTRVASGTKKTQGISAAITPGTTMAFAVNITPGAASTATDHTVIPVHGQIFEVQDNNSTDGVEAASINKNANIELNAGNATTKQSGHELNESTINTTNTLDLKILGLLNTPDNAFSGWARVEVMFNHSQYADQSTGI